MSSGMESYEALVGDIKAGLFDRLATELRAQPPMDTSAAEGAPLQLLEVGIGTGPNLRHLAKAFGSSSGGGGGGVGGGGGDDGGSLGYQITGIDPNPAMQPYAVKSAAAAGLPEGALVLRLGSAEALPWPEATFDAAVCTLVRFCMELVGVVRQHA
jgi:ubiquinone/menaquinone biosynthesis C-methylase UbiE